MQLARVGRRPGRPPRAGVSWRIEYRIEFFTETAPTHNSVTHAKGATLSTPSDGRMKQPSRVPRLRSYI